MRQRLAYLDYTEMRGYLRSLPLGARLPGRGPGPRTHAVQ
jgi:hypothetical protein